MLSYVIIKYSKLMRHFWSCQYLLLGFVGFWDSHLLIHLAASIVVTILTVLIHWVPDGTRVVIFPLNILIKVASEKSTIIFLAKFWMFLNNISRRENTCFVYLVVLVHIMLPLSLKNCDQFKCTDSRGIRPWLTHWDQGKMPAILHTTILIAICSVKKLEFRLQFHQFVRKGRVDNIPSLVHLKCRFCENTLSLKYESERNM